MSRYGYMLPDHHDAEDEERPVARCKYCGSTEVEWIHTGVRWRLFDNEARRPHQCEKVASPDDFEVLP